MMIDATLESMEKHLKAKGFDLQMQTETGQLYMLIRIEKNDFPLFVRVYEDSPFVQLLLFIPCRIKETAMGDLARLLHLFNKEVDVPGFGMDEKTGVVFFRVMVPLQEKKVDEKLLEALLQTMRNVCENFANAIATVASGTATFEAIMSKAKQP